MPLNRLLSYVRTKFVLVLIAPLLFQFLPPRVIAQRIDDRTSALARFADQTNDESDSPQSKIAPDLEQSLDEAFQTRHGNRKQRIIIQLRGAASVDQVDEVSSTNQQMRDEMFAGEERANAMRAPVMRAKIESLQGRYERSLNRLGLISAVLPLSKIRELENDPEVAYISPDRPVASSGHL